MNHPLNFFQADLNLTVSSLCKHVRSNVYKTVEKKAEAMLLMAHCQVLSNELGIYIHYHKLITEALEKYLSGQPFNEYAEEDKPETIYQYCRHFFEEADCPLGTATEELTAWMTTYADRQKMMSQASNRMLSGAAVSIQTTDPDGKLQTRLATGADKFEMETQAYLNDIQLGNALDNYNEQMQQVHKMLLAEAPPADILNAMYLDYIN